MCNAFQVIYFAFTEETAFFSVDADAQKVLILCSTPKGSTLKANEWVNSCAALVGGRGGGKDVQAQAAGKELGKVNEAIEAAKAFAQEKL